MIDAQQSGNYFAHSLQNRLDITDRYLALGDLPNLVGVSIESEEKLIRNVRNLLVEHGGGISKVTELGQSANQWARSIYRENLIAAIDGTDAISPLRFVSDTLYGVGVVRVTPQSAHLPRARVTRTRASSYVSSQDLSKTWEETVRDWGQYLRGARDQELSWVSTFREYEEREVAQEWLEENNDRIVLIDGPLLTQNLLSQIAARDLLERMIISERAIGFIKDLTPNPLLVAIGCALQSGEAFVLSHWSNLLRERFLKGQEAIASWVQEKANSMTRVVYKLNRKPYGIECLHSLIPLAFAILQQDPGGSKEHDIPMLLQIADAHVRAQFDGLAAKNEVLARYSLDDSTRFLTLTHERTLR